MMQNDKPNISDLRGFEHKTFSTITNGTILVKWNKFTGDIRVIKKSGFKVSILPWVTQKTYSVLPQQLNTPPASSYTMDVTAGQGPKISYDTDYMYIISNPQKYTEMELSESSQNNPKSTLKIIGERLDNMVRLYVSTKTIKDFIGRNSIDILNMCQAELNIIEADYGVKITKMTIDKIQLPKEISEQIEKNMAEKLKIEEEKYSKEARVIKAQGDAEVKNINSEAEAVKIQKIIRSGLEATRDANGNMDYMCRAIGQKLVNEGLVNGTNPNTTVIATNAVNNAFQQSLNPNGMLDINTLTSILLGAIGTLNRNNNNNNNNNVNSPQSKPSTKDNNLNNEDDDIDWERYLVDDEYADEVDKPKTR